MDEDIGSTPFAAHWKRIGIRHHHGICTPLFSLRTKNSSGIGEYLDLLPLIDWCKSIKMDVIQLLPLNDAGDDPSPYNALSSCALHPLYLSLHALPELDKYPELRTKLDDLQKLNESQRVAFQDVQSHKLVWLRDYFTLAGDSVLNTKEYLAFKESQPWLKRYALFRVIKDLVSKNHWMSWPQELQTPTEEGVEELLNRYSQEVSFYYLLQYLCFQQMHQAKTYANSQGIFIKGDMPFLISPDSVDVWEFPQYFDLSLAAGAPPDFYNKEGQYWGFPIFKWDVIQADDYQWFKRRLDYCSELYDLYRIDHVLGFFRIWAIPLERPSKEGHYIPEDQSVWEQQASAIFSMLAKSSTILPIAEDLGVTSDLVRATLKKFGICGTKVMRWERAWETDGHFIPIDAYPPMSMTTVSTHDSETLALWWRDLPKEARDYAQYKKWRYIPLLSAEQRQSILWDSHHTSSLFHIDLLQEYLALFPDLVWEDPEDERINIPGKVLPTNWTYRFRPSVEEIAAHEPLRKKMAELLSK